MGGVKKKKPGRPRKLGRTRFDAMVDLDLKRSANAERLKKPNAEPWPFIVERMLRYLEGGVSTQDLITALEIVLSDLESDIKSEYEGTKQLGERLAVYEPIRQTLKRAKWLEHNRR